MRIYTNVSTCASEHLKSSPPIKEVPDPKGRNSADEEWLWVVVEYIHLEDEKKRALNVALIIINYLWGLKRNYFFGNS